MKGNLEQLISIYSPKHNEINEREDAKVDAAPGMYGEGYQTGHYELAHADDLADLDVEIIFSPVFSRGRGSPLLGTSRTPHTQVTAGIKSTVFFDLLITFYRRYSVLFKLFIFVLYYVVGVLFFSQEEGWRVIDCVYFITETTTTIGTGYFHPTTEASRLFSIFYNIIGVTLVLSLCSAFARDVLTHAHDSVIYMCHSHLYGPRRGVTERELWRYRVLLSVFCVLLCVLSGTLFFHGNEGWPVIDSLYWTVCLMTTIGYGDLIVQYDSTRVFTIFFIYASVLIFAVAFSNAVDSWQATKKRHRLRQSLIALSSDRFGHRWCRRVLRPLSPRLKPLSHVPAPTSTTQQVPVISSSDTGIITEAVTNPLHTDPRVTVTGQLATSPLASLTSVPHLDQGSKHSPDSQMGVPQTALEQTTVNDSLLRVQHPDQGPMISVQYPNLGRPFDPDSLKNVPYPDLGSTLTPRTVGMLPGSCSQDRFVLHVLAELGLLSLRRDVAPLVKKFRELDTLATGAITHKELIEFCAEVSAISSSAQGDLTPNPFLFSPFHRPAQGSHKAASGDSVTNPLHLNSQMLIQQQCNAYTRESTMGSGWDPNGVSDEYTRPEKWTPTN